MLAWLAGGSSVGYGLSLVNASWSPSNRAIAVLGGSLGGLSLGALNAGLTDLREKDYLLISGLAAMGALQG